MRLKHVPLFILICSYFATAIAQNKGVSISETNSDPDPSAALDVQSNSQGFLAPRMTSIERDAIVNPATGLLVYVTDNTPGFYTYDGMQWKAIEGNTGGSTDTDWTDDGTNVYRLSGNVGIGINTPDNPLDVVSDDADLHLNSSNTASASGIILEANRPNSSQQLGTIEGIWGGNRVGLIEFLTGTDNTNKDDGFMDFWVRQGGSGVQHAMRIAQDGNIGVGTTSPTARLEIGGAAGVDGIKFPDGTLQTTAASGGSDTDWDESTNGVIFNTTDNVGIGTNAPIEKLHVTDGNVSAGENVIIGDRATIGQTGGGLATIMGDNVKSSVTSNQLEYIQSRATAGGRVIKMQSAEGITFHTFTGSTTSGGPYSGNERMRITDAGNVGIGTITPTAKLDVTGTIKIVDGSQGAGKVLTSDASGNATWQVAPSGIDTDWDESTSGVIFNTTDNVGIGTNAPTEKLHVTDGNVLTGENIIVGDRATIGQTGNGLATVIGDNVKSSITSNQLEYIQSRPSAGGRVIKMQSAEGITFHTTTGSTTSGSAYSGNERMRITDAGNVGIGTDIPTEKLHIGGNTRVDGIMDANDHIEIADGKELRFEGTGNSFIRYNGQARFISSGNSGTAFETAILSSALDEGIKMMNFNGTTVHTYFKDTGADGRAGFGFNFINPTAVVHIKPVQSAIAFKVETENDPNALVVNNEIGSARDNVGIGTATPTAKLEVAGKTKTQELQVTNGTPAVGKVLTSDAAGNATWQDAPSGSSSPWTDNGDNSIFTNNGRVGIGIGSPTSELHIVDNAAAFQLNIDPTAGGYTGKIDMDGTAMNIEHNSGGRDIRFKIQDQLRMVIKPNGNVGVGATTPEAKFHVAGKIQAQELKILNGAAVGKVLTSDVDGNATWQDAPSGGADTDWTDDGTNIHRLNGNVGVGTSTSSGKLTVAGGPARDAGWNSSVELVPTVAEKFPSLFFGGQSATDYSAIIWTESLTGNDNTQMATQIVNRPDGNGGFNLEFRTNDAIGTTFPQERMRITADGNIGIGAANPTAKLEIGGTTKTADLQVINEVVAGNIGVGASPTSQTLLHVNKGAAGIPYSTFGNTAIFENNDNSAIYINSATGHQAIYFGGSGQTFSAGIEANNLALGGAGSLVFKTGGGDGVNTAMVIDNNKDIAVSNLSGTGDRMVIAGADGTLSTQAIPSGGGSDGNGIYDGNGTLSGNTTVDMQGNTLKFEQNLDNFLSELQVQNTNTGASAAVSITMTNDVNRGIQFGTLGSNSTNWPLYGGAGDNFIRGSAQSGNLNIMTDNTAGGLRFFGKSNVNGSSHAHLFIQSGRVSINQDVTTGDDVLSVWDRSTQSNKLLAVLDNGNINISNLSGTGDRMVIAGADGTLSTQAIPSGGADTDWDESTAGVVFNTTDNVGIGISTPTAKLQVSGSVKIKDLPPSGGAEHFSVDGRTTSNIFRLFDTGGSSQFAESNSSTYWGLGGASAFGVRARIYGAGNSSSQSSLVIYDIGGEEYARFRDNKRIYFGGGSNNATRLNIIGETNDASTYGLLIENSDLTDILTVRNDGKIGVGTATPSSELDVIGKTSTSELQVTTGAGTAGQVLTSDASGNATWEDAPSGSLNLISTPSASGDVDLNETNEFGRFLAFKDCGNGLIQRVELSQLAADITNESSITVSNSSVASASYSTTTTVATDGPLQGYPVGIRVVNVTRLSAGSATISWNWNGNSYSIEIQDGSGGP